MKKLLLLTIFILFSLFFAPKAFARPALGIHLLDPNELTQAIDLIEGTAENPGAVTVVLRADDHNLAKWQQFFDIASRHNIKPIIRLATNMESDGWRRPNSRDLIHHATFLNFLDWHSDTLPIIIFNEPNHAVEWGGAVDPRSYADILTSAANIFHHKSKTYLVLPAGLDAAAPNSSVTMDSLVFLRQMLSANPDLISYIDGWTSHSYPNPGFVGSPYANGKSSIRGFTHELTFLKKYSPRDLDVYITETGWKKTPQNALRLPEYYSYAVNEVWVESQIKAITPFVFAAASGPFQAFSFTNPDGSPTPQYLALQKLKLAPSLRLLTSINK